MQSANRRKYIRALLFYTCLTGKRLLAAGFDPDKIEWEECHPKIGSKPGDCFGVDQPHVDRVIADVKPHIVLRFGKVACSAVIRGIPGQVTPHVLNGPHPAARQTTVMDDLRRMYADMQRLIGSQG